MSPHRTAPIHNVVDDPLCLATLYRTGYGTQWNSLREAAAHLKAFNMTIGFARIREAVALSELPAEILQLFDVVGIVNHTARGLLRAVREHGLETLVARAREVNACGKTRAQVLALLCGTEVAASSYQRTSYRPLALAERYNEGLRTGAWSSTTEAAQTLGIHQSRISEANMIAALPEEMKALFPNIRAKLGWQLVQLTKVRGSKTMRALAIEASKTIPRLSQQQLINHFVGLKGKAVDVRVKRAAGNLVLEFHCDASDPDNETRLAMLATWLNTTAPRIR
ncbi:hypothetical protein PQR70_42045 [Paraburkholderia madseniana]|uniref:hypothetical protein n=1 Tax=Paraburkholderia madseniana TaxID=2599607 RepID=UPI0038BD7D2B